MDEITTVNSGLNADYLITVRQFIDEGFAEKIQRGECRVYEFSVEPPPNDAPAAEKRAYEMLKASGGLFTEIVEVEVLEPGYCLLKGITGLGGMGAGMSKQLLVITHERWR